MRHHKYILLILFGLTTTITGITGIIWDKHDKLTYKNHALAKKTKSHK